MAGLKSVNASISVACRSPFKSDRGGIEIILSEYMRYGGFPEVVLQNVERLKVEQLKNYFTGIVARDVLMRYSLRDASKIGGVSHLLLTGIAATVSARKLGNTLGLATHRFRLYPDS